MNAWQRRKCSPAWNEAVDRCVKRIEHEATGYEKGSSTCSLLGELAEELRGFKRGNDGSNAGRDRLLKWH